MGDAAAFDTDADPLAPLVVALDAGRPPAEPWVARFGERGARDPVAAAWAQSRDPFAMAQLAALGDRRVTVYRARPEHPEGPRATITVKPERGAPRVVAFTAYALANPHYDPCWREACDLLREPGAPFTYDDVLDALDPAFERAATGPDDRDRDALAPLLDALERGAPPPAAWVARFAARADDDPLAAAWRAADDPRTMARLLAAREWAYVSIAEPLRLVPRRLAVNVWLASRGVHVWLRVRRGGVLDPADRAAAVAEIRRLERDPPPLDALLAHARRARMLRPLAGAPDARAPTGPADDPIAVLAAHLARRERPPLWWMIEWTAACAPGDAPADADAADSRGAPRDPVAAAWRASSDAGAMILLLALLRDRAHAHAAATHLRARAPALLYPLVADRVTSLRCVSRALELLEGACASLRPVPAWYLAQPGGATLDPQLVPRLALLSAELRAADCAALLDAAAEAVRARTATPPSLGELDLAGAPAR